MGVISQNGIDYPVPSVPVQSDGSATDLTNAAVPTGQTIKSYLNSNLSNFLTVRSTTATITRANASGSTISAPTVTGYTFLCWLSAVSTGWIGNIYIESPTQATSNIWSANYGYNDPDSGNVTAFALYVKNM